MSQPTGTEVPGLFTLVLHTHLPWLAHHGRWPVGEEWLYQSWAAAYLPLMRVLRTLANEDRHSLVTLGVTPVVNALATVLVVVSIAVVVFAARTVRKTENS